MPNEQVANPIEITPVDSFVENENQSGHKAVFSGASYDTLRDKINQDLGLKEVWNHEMTDEEALLELQHGKTESPEYHEAQQRLVAKVVARYGETDSNFLQRGNRESFKQSLDKDWTHASQLLGVNVSKGLQDKPSKGRMLETLSDSARLYNRAYVLTREYVRNHLVEPKKLKEYNNLDPQLRREMLGLFRLPAGAKVPNDGFSGVQEKWMYSDQKPDGVKPPDGPKPPEPDNKKGQEEKAKTELDTLFNNIAEYVRKNFSIDDIKYIQGIIKSIAIDSQNWLSETRVKDQQVLFFIHEVKDHKTQIAIVEGIAFNKAQTFDFNDIKNEQIIEKMLVDFQAVAKTMNLTFEQFMLLNMGIYGDDIDTKESVEQDFNFKRHLLESYKALQVVKPAIKINAENRWGAKNTSITAISVTDEIKAVITKGIENDPELDAQAGNFAYFYQDSNGVVQFVDRFDLATAGYFVPGIDALISQRAYENDPVPQVLVRIYLDDILIKLNALDILNGQTLLEQAEVVRSVLLTKLDIPQSAVAGSIDYRGFEDKLRLAIWEKYKIDNNITG